MLSYRLSSLVFCLVTTLFTTLSGGPAEGGTFQAADVTQAREIQAQIRASHFLSKATFGPSKAEIVALGERIEQIGYRRACNEWIDNQFAIVDEAEANPSSHPLVRSHLQTMFDMLAQDGIVYPSGGDYPDNTIDTTNRTAYVPRYRMHAWWDNALRGEDQLRQRFAWALSLKFL